MPKYTDFRDIPQFTSWGNYAVDMGLLYAYEHIVKEWASDERKDEFGYGLQLDPDFQRGHVWNDAKKTAWMEYVLRGGKSGRDIFLNHPGWMGSYVGDFVLVDGKQRLDAIRSFVENEIKVFGTYYRNFKGKMPHTDPSLRVHVNNLKTREEVLQWYLDLNSGGVVHTDEEIEKVRVLLAAEKRKK